MRRRWQQLREEWAASSAALERGTAARHRRQQREAATRAHAPSPEYSAGDITTMNAATICGAIATIITNS
ncbi:hypothetical protein [Amycolatopsis rifamycinica]|uniref:Uncharacterized protein n=1 Tax=Amycolatopsis rifamycinica TaxID=287986 RepID=A0A066UGG2_9PSEU|nr:hypothetical protein [Amycolatopsis rifamycinica]KDN23224.1 hypothetical protein DV20_05770 [Amycolatopsis rifamycinica]